MRRVALWALLLSSCSDHRDPAVTYPGDPDDHLIASVTRAAAEDHGLPALVARVGLPTMSTEAPNDRASVLAADFAPDPERPDEGPPPSRWHVEANQIVYWRRPGTWENPRVVGVVVYPSGEQEMFFAEILPP